MSSSAAFFYMYSRRERREQERKKERKKASDDDYRSLPSPKRRKGGEESERECREQTNERTNERLPPSLLPARNSPSRVELSSVPPFPCSHAGGCGCGSSGTERSWSCCRCCFISRPWRELWSGEVEAAAASSPSPSLPFLCRTGQPFLRLLLLFSLSLSGFGRAVFSSSFSSFFPRLLIVAGKRREDVVCTCVCMYGHARPRTSSSSSYTPLPPLQFAC